MPFRLHRLRAIMLLFTSLSHPNKRAESHVRAAATLVALGVAFISPVASGECRIDDSQAYLPNATVSASGTTFSLGLVGVPVQVTPDAGGANARVEVLSPLRFTAAYPGAELRYRIKRAVDLYGGRIRLGQGAMPEWLGVRGNALEVSLANALHVGVTPPLRVPCSHLALSDGKTPYATPEPVKPAAGRGAGTGAGQVPLHLSPVATDPLAVQFPGAYEIESRRPGWVLLQASWADGSRLRGWTREQFVTSEPGPLDGSVTGITSGASCGRADSPILTTFIVRKGAPIAASPAGAPWAWATRRLTVDAFPLDRADGWIRIGTVAGLASAPCAEHEHLWVHASDLVWPHR